MNAQMRSHLRPIQSSRNAWAHGHWHVQCAVGIGSSGTCRSSAGASGAWACRCSACSGPGRQLGRLSSPGGWDVLMPMVSCDSRLQTLDRPADGTARWGWPSPAHLATPSLSRTPSLDCRPFGHAMAALSGYHTTRKYDALGFSWGLVLGGWVGRGARRGRRRARGGQRSSLHPMRCTPSNTPRTHRPMHRWGLGP